MKIARYARVVLWYVLVLFIGSLVVWLGVLVFNVRDSDSFLEFNLPEAIQALVALLLGPFIAYYIQNSTFQSSKRLDYHLQLIGDIEQRFLSWMQEILCFVYYKSSNQSEREACSKIVDGQQVLNNLKNISADLETLSHVVNGTSSGREAESITKKMREQFELVNELVTAKWGKSLDDIGFDSEEIRKLEKAIREMRGEFTKLKVIPFSKTTHQ